MTSERVAGQHDYFPRFGGLKAFYEVALTGSAVQAAERLKVSASSVSHQVKALEAELGVRLIENRRGKLVPTADGALYFEQIKGPMAEILRATESVRSMPGRKRVSLTLTPSFAVGWLMPRLIDLDCAQPDLEVNLITTTRVVDLARENVDLAIRRGGGRWEDSRGEGYLAEPLLRETIVPVAAPGLLEEHGISREHAGTSLEAAIEAAFKTTRVLVNTTVEGEWDAWCAARGITPPDALDRYNLETYELTVQAARDGLGIALGRKPLIDPLLTSGELVQPFPSPDREEVSYFILRRDEPMKSDVKRLYDWLLAQAR